MDWSEAFKVGLATLAALGGSGALVLLLSGWLGRVWASRILENEKAQHQQILLIFQRETSQLLEQERAKFQRELQEISHRAAQDLQKAKERSDAILKGLESELATRRQVHALQFEREFKNYSETWKKLLELSAKTLALRPVHEVHDARDSANERKKRRSDAFVSAYGDFENYVATEKPFFPKSVHDKLRELTTIVRREFLGYNRGKDPGGGFDMRYWDEAEENQQKVLDKIDEICEAIRTRIGLIESTTSPDQASSTGEPPSI